MLAKLTDGRSYERKKIAEKIMQFIDFLNTAPQDAKIDVIERLNDLIDISYPHAKQLISYSEILDLAIYYFD